MKKETGGKIAVKKYVERGTSRSFHKFLLLIRKERRLTIGIALLVAALFLAVSSLVFLIPSSMTGGNVLYTTYSMGSNSTKSFELQYHVAPNSYENMSYSITPGSYVHLRLAQEPHKVVGSSTQSTVLTQDLHSNGVFSFHQGDSSAINTIYVTMHTNDSSGNFNFSLTVSSYYPLDVDPYTMGGAVISFGAFGIVVASLIGLISRNPEAYWLKMELGEDESKRKKYYRIVSIRGEKRREIRVPSLVLLFASLIILAFSQSVFAGTSGQSTFQLMTSLLVIVVSATLFLYSAVSIAVNWIIGERYE